MSVGTILVGTWGNSSNHVVFGRISKVTPSGRIRIERLARQVVEKNVSMGDIDHILMPDTSQVLRDQGTDLATVHDVGPSNSRWFATSKKKGASSHYWVQWNGEPVKEHLYL